MRAAEEFHQLGPGLFEWSAYDPAVKVDLHAHALVLGERLTCIDPIPLQRAAQQELFEAAGVSTVDRLLLTNGNHARAAGKFRQSFGASVRAPEAAWEALREDGLETDGAPDGPEAIALPGFGPGEVAYFSRGNGGTLFIGDALINLPPYGFSVLPEKYCSDARLTRDSLRGLLDLEFTRMLFAHGPPLVHGARAKLAGLFATLKV